MLANLLAVIIGIGSLAFYLAAFILPEVHRRSDFFWSGVGLFYAVVLWYCARQLNGAVLLGQTASVGLLLWLGYQTLLMRRQTTPAAQQTPLRLGKSERGRAASRPIAKDYEFVEDGVEDAVDQEPDADSLIVIKPAADEFALKMVVPAAMPPPSIEENDAPKKPPTVDPPTPPNPAQAREKPNPLAAMGIFVGWLKDVVTPPKKAPKPMIELPPRPPSIPKPPNPDAVTKTTASALVDAPSDAPSDAPAPSEQAGMPTDGSADNKPLETTAEPEGDEEESNWPDDNFWD